MHEAAIRTIRRQCQRCKQSDFAHYSLHMCPLYSFHGMGAKYYCDARVCVYVCLARISQKPHSRTSPDFLCLLPAVAVARSRSGGVAMFCTSGFVVDVMLSYYGPNDGVLQPHQRHCSVSIP